MHELSVTQGILAIVLDTARRNGCGQVTAVNLVIGDLSSFVDDSVQFYFDYLSRDTPAAGAVLNFRREAATATCWDCSLEFKVKAPLLGECPACGSVRLHITGGQEFFVESIEVDDEDSGR